MHLDRALFPPLFEQVRKVQETMRQYCLADDSIPLPKQNLRFAIEQEYDVSIEVYTVPLDSSLLRGMIEMYEGRSVIYVDGELSSAWTRYVFAKEASHHLLDDDEFHTTNPLGIIEYIVIDEDEIDGTVAAPKDVATESLTKFAAIELLFPFDMRRKCKEEVETGEKTLYSVAEYFDIPEHLVQFALSDLYADFSASVWAKIEDS